MHAYAALYDVTPDWLPFVGLRTGIAGHCDACGGSGHAFKTRPDFCAGVARLMIDGVVREGFSQFSHERIAAGNLFQQAFGGKKV